MGLNGSQRWCAPVVARSLLKAAVLLARSAHFLHVSGLPSSALTIGTLGHGPFQSAWHCEASRATAASQSWIQGLRMAKSAARHCLFQVDSLETKRAASYFEVGTRGECFRAVRWVARCSQRSARIGLRAASAELHRAYGQRRARATLGAAGDSRARARTQQLPGAARAHSWSTRETRLASSAMLGVSSGVLHGLGWSARLLLTDAPLGAQVHAWPFIPIVAALSGALLGHAPSRSRAA
jgi:hypothetical protein